MASGDGRAWQSGSGGLGLGLWAFQVRLKPSQTESPHAELANEALKRLVVRSLRKEYFASGTA